MNNPTLAQYIHAHMSKTTDSINTFIHKMPGTPEEQSLAYSALTQYYEALIENLRSAETMTFATQTLLDIYKEEEKKEKKEKDKARELPGFDSIRPGQNTVPRRIDCVICGGEMVIDPTITYTSIPPQYKYICNKCGRTIVHPLIV